MISALDALRRIVRALHVSHRVAEQRLKISGAQLLILQRLGEAPARSVNDLAERTFTHQSTVSTVVERLVARGLVKREHTPDDRRRVVHSLTPAGRSMLRRALNLAHVRLIGALNSLPPHRLRSLAHDLGMVVQAMGVAATPAPLFFEDGRPDRAKRSSVRSGRSSSRRDTLTRRARR